MKRTFTPDPAILLPQFCNIDLPRLVGSNRQKLASTQPLIPMAGDKRVVVQVRIGVTNAVNLRELAGAECLVLIEAPAALQQALAAQHFMQPGDAALISI